MYFPLLHEQVRMSHRPDQFTVIRVDYTDCVADICPLLAYWGICENVPFRQLLAPLKLRTGQAPPSAHEDRIASSRALVHGTRVHVATASILIIDVEDSLRATRDAIGRSLQAIAASDRLIAHVQGICAEDVPDHRPRSPDHLITEP